MKPLNFFGKRMDAAAVMQLLAIIAVLSGVLLSASPCLAVNNALTFDGANDYVTVSPIPAWANSSPMTIEAWIKTSDGKLVNDILSWGNSSIMNGVEFRTTNGKLQLLKNPTAASVTSATSVNTGNWTHIAAVKDASNNVILYVNGIQDASGSLSTDSITADLFYIGVLNWGGISLTSCFNGQIDEVRIWNVARTQAEIKQYMNTALTGAESGLVAYYNFDQTSGTTLPDLATTPTADNGTLTNMTGSEWTASGAPVPMTAPGNGLSFNGSNQYVQVPNASSLITNSNITIMGWVYPRTVCPPDWSDTDAIIGFRNDSNADFYIYQTPSTNIEARFRNSSGTTYTITTTTDVLTVNQWQHLAMTYNGSTLRLYLNGTEIGNTSASGVITNGTVPFGIGTIFSGADYLNGKLDEVRIWNTARSQTDIQNNMHNTLNPSSEANLVAYYRFDQAGGATLTDYTAGNYHGTLVNSPTWTASGAMCPFPISATNVTATGFTANWNAVSGATGYRIDVSTDPNFGSFITNGSNIAAGSSTSFNITGLTLTPGTAYYFRMRAEKSGWTSPDSATVPVMFPPGNALQFDGTDDYVTVPDNANLNFTGAFTLEAWIYKNTSFPGWSGIIRKGYYFLVGIQSTDRVRFGFVDSSSAEYDCDSVSDIPNNQWVHIAGVYDGANMIIYINGVADKSTNIGSHTILTSASPLNLGESSSYYFNGQMDEVRIWNVARSQGDIQSNMLTTLAGNESGLVAYYSFDWTSGTTLPDIAGGDNNGTLTNTVGYVTTGTVSPITTTTASVGGTLVTPGISSVTVSGICYAVTPNPTTPCTTDGSLTPGSYTSPLTGLTPGTLYYARAYATNLYGTSYGSDITFATRYIPVIAESSPVSVTMSEDGLPAAWTPPTVSATDGDGDTLTWSVGTPALHGTAAVSGTGASPTIFTYAPAADYNGSDTFVVRAADADGSAEIIVNVTVNAVNDAPVITGQTALSTNEDTAIALALSNLTVSDIDNIYPAGFSLTVLTGSNYTISGSTITPSPNYNGTLTVPVKVNDGGLDSNTYNLAVTVNAVSDAPAITGQNALSINEDTALTIVLGNLTVSDIDNTYPTGFSLTVQSGTNYTVSGSTVTPAADFNGMLTVGVKVNDGSADSNVFNLSVAVIPADDPPTVVKAIADLTVDEDAADTLIDLSGVFGDIDSNVSGIVKTIVSNSNSSLLSAAVSGNMLTLKYLADQNGEAVISVKGAVDGKSADVSF
ncbi:MAG: hypothetical protein BWK80_15880, partial [Desulfobacteraceae bacterium IS3]